MAVEGFLENPFALTFSEFVLGLELSGKLSESMVQERNFCLKTAENCGPVHFGENVGRKLAQPIEKHYLVSQIRCHWPFSGRFFGMADATDSFNLPLPRRDLRRARGSFALPNLCDLEDSVHRQTRERVLGHNLVWSVNYLFPD